MTEEFLVDLDYFICATESRPSFACVWYWCILFKKWTGVKCSRVLWVWENTVIFCSALCGFVMTKNLTSQMATSGKNIMQW